mmetsp:Transcript_2909/g.9541  ORF Transcript_2909/g.9541 Transcript_2909/m.9541 type:complete len:366 (-) Transcript_2909:259-1356(-)
MRRQPHRRPAREEEDGRLGRGAGLVPLHGPLLALPAARVGPDRRQRHRRAGEAAGEGRPQKQPADGLHALRRLPPPVLLPRLGRHAHRRRHTLLPRRLRLRKGPARRRLLVRPLAQPAVGAARRALLPRRRPGHARVLPPRLALHRQVPHQGDDQRGGDRPRCGKQVHRGAGAALHRWRRPLADILAQVRRRGRLPSLLPHPLARHARRQRRRRARAVRRPVHREGAGVRLARLCDARRRRERRRDEPRRQAAHLLAPRRRGRLGRRAADRPSALHLLPRPAAARRGDVRRARAKPWADGGAARLARSGERGGGRGGAGRDGHSRRARHRSCCARRLRRVRSPPPPPPRPRRPPGGPAGGGQADG